MVDPQGQMEVLTTLRKAAEDAEDLLVIYFSGHGVIDNHGDLNLMLQDSRPELPQFTALPFNAVRRIIQESSARHKVIILDCCYSGRVASGPAFAQELTAVELTAAPDSYVISSTFHYDSSAEPRASFTRALLETLRAGVPGGPEYLTIDSLFKEVQRELNVQGMRDISLQRTGSQEPLVLTRNAAYLPMAYGNPTYIPSARELLDSFPEFRTSALLPSLAERESHLQIQAAESGDTVNCVVGAATLVGECPVATNPRGSGPDRRGRLWRTKIRRMFLFFVDGLARSLTIGVSPTVRNSRRGTAWERIDAQLRMAYDQLGPPPPNSQGEGPGTMERPRH
jgi:hypothetical protein